MSLKDNIYVYYKVYVATSSIQTHMTILTNVPDSLFTTQKHYRTAGDIKEKNEELDRLICPNIQCLLIIN